VGADFSPPRCSPDAGGGGRRTEGAASEGRPLPIGSYLSAKAYTVRKPCWLILAMSSPLTFSTLSLG